MSAARPTPAPPRIDTPRLVLRRPAPGDAQAIFDAYSSDPAVTRFLTWTTHGHVDHAHTFLRRCDAVWTDGSAYPWAIAVGGRLMCDVENTASARVLEKAGMTREGCLRAWAAMPAFAAPRDVWCYAAVKEAP